MRWLNNYISKHWYGRTSFSVVLFNLVGVSALINTVIAKLNVLGLWMPLLILSIVVVWQIVGSVRFAERVLNDGADSRVFAVYGAVIVTVILSASRATSFILPQPELSLEIVGQTPKIEILETSITVFGDIDYRSLMELKEGISKHPKIKTVVLKSKGGNPIAGRSIGIFISDIGLNTHVDEECYSACTLAFAGGNQRSLGPDGRLGFHGYRFDNALRIQTVDVTEIAEKDQEFLASRGFSQAFIKHIFETPPEEIWRPTKEALLAAGVLTKNVP